MTEPTEELPLDPTPWKCKGEKTRLAIGRTQGHPGDCLEWKPRKGYEQRKKTYFKDNAWMQKPQQPKINEETSTVRIEGVGLFRGHIGGDHAYLVPLPTQGPVLNVKPGQVIFGETGQRRTIRSVKLSLASHPRTMILELEPAQPTPEELGWERQGDKYIPKPASKPRLSDAIKAVVSAWLIEGVSPSYHRKAKKNLKEQWPTLHSALDQLALATAPESAPKVKVTPNPVAPPKKAKKPLFTIHIVVTRNDDGVSPWQITLVGRKRAFIDAAQTLRVQWAHFKYGRDS